MGAEVKKFTWSEIEVHKAGGESVWVVIHNEVYDVTKFQAEHPGGGDILLENAGQDATKAFEDAGHSLDAREMMMQYKIGEVDVQQESNGKTCVIQ